MKPSKRWKAVLAAGIAAVVLAACGGGSAGDEAAGNKAGGDAAPVTLKLGTPDQRGFPASDDLEHFASTVKRLSSGRIQVDITWEAQGPGAGRFDQRVAEMVRDGKLDLALVPARAWDELGVTTLQALQAPFLIDSDALMNKVATSDLVDEMLAGLGAAKVQGLTLWPESLRHPVGFKRPFLSLADFKGAKVRAPLSKASFELLRALGAEPVDLSGEALTRAVRTGELAGAESSLPLASRLPAAGTFTANITFFPKVNALVIGQKAFDRLDASQRSILQDAAAQTLDHLLKTNLSSAAEVAKACAAGVAVANASEEDVSGLEKAAQPVSTRLEQDPQTKQLIERIRAMKTDLQVASASLRPCSTKSQGTGSEIARDPSVLNGTYRTSFTAEELEAAGADRAAAVDNSGLWTIVLADGRYRALSDECTAAYTVSGDKFTFKWDQFTPCTGDFSATWSLRDGKLRFTNVAAADAVDRAIWGLHPWIKIA
jgi:TRAP-type C4-dicarboxylate transport system substrate-binding protein